MIAASTPSGAWGVACWARRGYMAHDHSWRPAAAGPHRVSPPSTVLQPRGSAVPGRVCDRGHQGEQHRLWYFP